MGDFMTVYRQKATPPLDDEGNVLEANEALEQQRKDLEKAEKEMDATSEEFAVKQAVKQRLKDARTIAAEQKRPLSEVVEELNKTKEVEKKLEEQVKKDMAEENKGEDKPASPKKQAALKEQLPVETTKKPGADVPEGKVQGGMEVKSAPKGGGK